MAVILIAQHLHAGTDVPRLTFAQSTRMDIFFDFFRGRLRQRLYGRISRKKILHYNIDSGIRTLGSQTHADEQFPRIIIIQATMRLRVFFL